MSPLSASPYYIPWPIRACFSDEQLSFKSFDKRIANIEQATMRWHKRPLIDCSEIPETRIDIVLHRFGFLEAGLQKIYRAFGQGNCAEGRQIVFKKLQDRTLTIERIGFTEKDPLKIAPKFYIIITHPIVIEGGHSVVLNGYSTAGTPRIINVTVTQGEENPAAAKNLSHKSHPCSEVICRLKRYEEGIKVSEKGEEDLWEFAIEKLSDRARLGMYLLLLRNLALFHQSGFVHRDLKLENIVVLRNESRELIGLKFIDLDTLAREGEKAEFDGTEHLFSYTQLLNRQNSLEAFPDQKDDVWGVMLVLCDLERRALYHPENSPLIHPKILERYQTYIDVGITLSDSAKKGSSQFAAKMIRLFNDLGEESLFAELSLDKEYPLDSLILRMAMFQNAKRPSVQELLNDLDSARLLTEKD
jgi:hypothetical protein